MSKLNYIPDGYSSITPYLIFNGASEAIDFYKKVFGATEITRMPGPDGRIGHAEMRFGSSVVMLADESPQMNHYGPQHYGGSPIGLLFYVEDVDKVVEQALAAGAKLDRPVADQFYGDRTGGVVDPYGYRWYIATHIKDVSQEEMQAAVSAMSAG
jgi:PhnB protein